jgi:hypothetical protein
MEAKTSALGLLGPLAVIPFHARVPKFRWSPHFALAPAGVDISRGGLLC